VADADLKTLSVVNTLFAPDFEHHVFISPCACNCPSGKPWSDGPTVRQRTRYWSHGSVCQQTRKLIILKHATGQCPFSGTGRSLPMDWSSDSHLIGAYGDWIHASGKIQTLPSVQLIIGQRNTQWPCGERPDLQPPLCLSLCSTRSHS